MARIYQNFIMDSTRWQHFVPRRGDVVIATSYKAGTTWLQAICAALVFQKPEPPLPQDAISPWLDAKFAPIEEVIAQIEAQEHRRYLKTHLPMDGIPVYDDVRYVFVGRDGLDVFMSLWNHWNNMQPSGIADLNSQPDRVGAEFGLPPAEIGSAFDEWTSKGSFAWESDGSPFWSHLSHAETWWRERYRDNVLHVHFDDLLADPDHEMRRISAFLDIPVDEGVWPELVRGVGFDAMKQNAEKMAPGATAGMWKDTKNFFHKGTNRRWQGVLTAEQVARYRHLSRTKLPPELDAWLARGRRATQDPKSLR